MEVILIRSTGYTRRGTFGVEASIGHAGLADVDSTRMKGNNQATKFAELVRQHARPIAKEASILAFA